MRTFAFLIAALALTVASVPAIAGCSPQHTVQAPTTPPQTPAPPVAGG